MSQSKKYKKTNFSNKTRRQSGGLTNNEIIKPMPMTTNAQQNPPTNNSNIIPDVGIIDMAGNIVKNTGEYAVEKLVRLFGFQPIPKDEFTNNSFALPSIFSDSTNIASKIASNVLKMVDQKSSSIIQKLNVFLENPNTSQTFFESSKNTVEIFHRLLQKFNDTLNDPIIKEEFIITIRILGEYAKIFVSAMDGPIDESMDLINNAVSTAISGVSSGAIRVITDLVGAVPFAGPIVDVGKAVNDGSKSIGSLVNSGTKAIEAASLLIGSTSQNIIRPLQQLQEKKQQAMEIANRAQDSINQFKQPFKQLSPDQSLSSIGQSLASTPQPIKGGTRKNNKKNKKNTKRLIR